MYKVEFTLPDNSIVMKIMDWEDAFILAHSIGAERVFFHGVTAIVGGTGMGFRRTKPGTKYGWVSYSGNEFDDPPETERLG